MHRSYRLGRVGETDVWVHWTVPALAALLGCGLYTFALPSAVAGRTPAAYANTAIQIVVLALASLAAHELAHVLVARHYGITVRRVTILPVGGWSEQHAARTRTELMVAAAGPTVNLLLSGVAEVAAMAAKTLGLSALTVVSLTWFSTSNVALALINLLPVAPLDGGRAVRTIVRRRRVVRRRGGAVGSASRRGRDGVRFS